MLQKGEKHQEIVDDRGGSYKLKEYKNASVQVSQQDLNSYEIPIEAGVSSEVDDRLDIVIHRVDDQEKEISKCQK